MEEERREIEVPFPVCHPPRGLQREEGGREANFSFSVVSSVAPSILDPSLLHSLAPLAGSCALSLPDKKKRRRKEERAAFDKVAILDLGLDCHCQRPHR